MGKLDKAYSELLSNLTLGQVVLMKVEAERLGRGTEDVQESSGWRFGFNTQIAKETEFTVQVRSMAEADTMSVTIVHQLQYNLETPVDGVDREVLGRFLGQSVIPTIAPYVRELVHGLGMRMQCDVPWLNVVGPQSNVELDDDDEDESVAG